MGQEFGIGKTAINTWVPGVNFTLFKVGRVRFGGLSVGPSMTWYKEPGIRYEPGQSSASFGVVIGSPISIDVEDDQLFLSISPGFDVIQKRTTLTFGFSFIP